MARISQGKIYQTDSLYSGVTEKKTGILLFDRKRSSLKRIRVLTQARRVVEVGTLLLGRDKSNVIVNKVLSYF